MDTHSLERTSPKGGPFIGRCVKCGKTDLLGSAVNEECPNPSGMTQAQDILNAIAGNQPSACPDDTEPSAEARWYLGSMNDGLFIINQLPRPSTDDMVHERPDGPSLVINVTDLPRAKAQAIVDGHNAALDRFRAAGVREAFEQAASECAPERFISETNWHDRDTARRIERRIRRRIPGASP